jgi:26S proteasome regulatory subunit N5
MSDGKLEKMDKDFSPQVDVLLPETEALTKVRSLNPMTRPSA